MSLFKKIILLTLFFIFSLFQVKTFAINFDLIASKFVNKMSLKYSKLSCTKQIDKMNYWHNKFININEQYSSNKKISRQQKILISILLQTIIKKFENEKNIIKYNCIENTIKTGNNVKNKSGGNILTGNQNNKNSQFSSLQKEMLNSVNNERQKNGKSNLILNEKLNNSAQKYAEYLYNINKGKQIGTNDFRFSHYSKDGKSPFDRIKAEGYEFTAAGENIAFGQTTINDVMKDWMNSPGHKKNILSSDFTELGVGYKGDFWVQNFGRPRK